LANLNILNEIDSTGFFVKIIAFNQITSPIRPSVSGHKDLNH